MGAVELTVTLNVGNEVELADTGINPESMACALLALFRTQGLAKLD